VAEVAALHPEDDDLAERLAELQAEALAEDAADPTPRDAQAVSCGIGQ
jgi:hypothetical protein